MKNPANAFLLAFALFCVSSVNTAAEELSTKQDHQRVLDLLGIEKLRRGADGNPDSEYAANYDESKANNKLGSLPPITTKNQSDWWAQQRPEIVEHFDREIYGRVPKNLPKVSWVKSKEATSTIAGIPVVVTHLIGKVDNREHPDIEVNIQMSVTLPEKQQGALPLVLEMSISPEFRELLKKRYTEKQLAEFNGGWQEQVIRKGWGYAELIPSSAQADNGEGLDKGIIGLANKGKPRNLEDWGVLRAWAWSASKAMDYFETNNNIDESRIAIEGHSRYGKAALVAMAYDSRFAVAFISSSGEAGAKLWRRNYGEQVGNIAGSGEYHWMAGNFLKYAGPLDVEDIPVDAHQLIALCAPRPVFISSGDAGDGWVDPKGMFLAALHSSPVYELLGKKGLQDRNFPEVGIGLMQGDIAWRQHTGGHTPGPNWTTFLEFSERYFSR